MAVITEYIEILLEGKDLSFEQSVKLLDTVFDGDVEDVQIAAFLAAMRAKRASVSEIAGLASSLRAHAVKVETGINELVDTCGTGGAPLKTFNISTAAGFVAAGAGCYVAKHGNRAITSKCGSADVLMELGVNIAPGPEKVAQCIKEAHIGFMFAPKFHPAMKHVQPVRQGLDFRTAFNILGPLANPAGAQMQVIGVPQEDLMVRIAEALDKLGVKRALVVHSEGLDEISIMAPTKTLELREGEVKAGRIDPMDYGFSLSEYDELKGSDAADNAQTVRRILMNELNGPKRDIVVLNAAAAIMITGRATDYAGGIEKANEAIDSGKAKEALDKLIEISNS
jgi:anthranilate phosphoribosyltransferase